MPGAPFPICITHAVQVVRYVSRLVEERVGDRPIDDTFDLLRRFHVVAAFDPDAPPIRQRREPDHVVYYIRLGPHIKIGTTTNIKQRLAWYPPQVVLLVTEPGGPEVEQMRHRQFAHLRDTTFGPKAEWFHDHPELRDHIATLNHPGVVAPA